MSFIKAWFWNKVGRLAECSTYLHKMANKSVISHSASMSRSRPHPYTMRHDYTSWTALTDRSYSGRHLGPEKLENLPAVEEVVELFRARDDKSRACEKSTLLFPVFAQFLTDGFIQTKFEEPSQPPDYQRRRLTESTHQIDLCQIYGSTEAQTNQLRAHDARPAMRGRMRTELCNGAEFAPRLYDKNGQIQFDTLTIPLGLKPDGDKLHQAFAFGGDRANSTPMVAMVATVFLREHNRIAALFCADPVFEAWDDERVFETTRNIMIVLLIKIIIEEYINHITSFDFKLLADPQAAWDARWNRPIWVTSEFSLLYRWHSTFPETVRVENKDVSLVDLMHAGDMLRDMGVARIFAATVREDASAMGAFNIATQEMMALETRAVEQARAGDLTTYANYCKSFGMEVPLTFEDISSDPEVVAKLEALYGSVDKVEFYPGIMCADPVPNSPLPHLLTRIVALDAFTQALTNPLLSRNMYDKDGRVGTFTQMGWDIIGKTETFRDLVMRNIPEGDKRMVPEDATMTKPGWEYTQPPTPIVTQIKETYEMRKSAQGRKLLMAFAFVTFAEFFGLILWLPLSQNGMIFWGVVALIVGEMIEWSALAISIWKNEESYYRKLGRPWTGVWKSWITAISEAGLWVLWLWLYPTLTILGATVLLCIGMHVKHVVEMAIYTGKPVRTHFTDERDITASVIESSGAGLWLWLWVSGLPLIGAIVLFATLSIEHILQFKSAGFTPKTQETHKE